MSPQFVLRWENVRCVAEVVNKSLKADCTDFTECRTCSAHSVRGAKEYLFEILKKFGMTAIGMRERERERNVLKH